MAVLKSSSAPRHQIRQTIPSTEGGSSGGSPSSGIDVKGALLGDVLYWTEGVVTANGSPNSARQLRKVTLDTRGTAAELLSSSRLVSSGEYSPSDPALWYNNSTIYGFQDSTLIDFTEPTSSWNRVESIGDIQIVPGESFANDPVYGRSLKANLNGPDQTSISILDTSVAGPPKFSSKATPLQRSRKSGAIFFVPAGERGVLVAIGGEDGSGSLIPMTDVDLYDIAKGTWHNVPNASTSGSAAQGNEPPGARTGFCGWVVASGNHWSIIIHGGISAGSTHIYGDIWNLRISSSSISWVKIGTARDITAESNNTRHGHQCLKYGNNYGFVLGGSTGELSISTPATSSPSSIGSPPSDSSQSRHAKSKRQQGSNVEIKILDLSTQQFQNAFEPGFISTPYNPSKIEEASTSSSSVNLTPEIQSLFESPMSPPASDISPERPALNTATSSRRSGLSTAAKAGIGAGVGASLIILLVIALLFPRRIRKRRAGHTPLAVNPGASKSFTATGEETDEADNFVSAHAHAIETQYRRSVSPAGVPVGAASSTQPYNPVQASAAEHDDPDSPSSTYSSLLEDHDGQHRDQVDRLAVRERRMSDVSSLGETAMVYEEHGTARGTEKGESALNRSIGGDISPVLSPVGSGGNTSTHGVPSGLSDLDQRNGR